MEEEKNKISVAVKTENLTDNDNIADSFEDEHKRNCRDNLKEHSNNHDISMSDRDFMAASQDLEKLVFTNPFFLFF